MVSGTGARTRLALRPMAGSRGWRYATAAFWIANGLNHFRAPKF
jgi:hypothetical protein